MLTPAALAATLHVAPGEPATGTGPCLITDPCQLEDAVENIAEDGDEVVMAAGTYSGAEAGDGSGGIDVADAIILRGDGAVGTSTIESTAESALEVAADAVVSDLAIEHAGSGNLRALYLTAGEAQRLFVRSTSWDACQVGGASKLRDAVCWSRGADGVQVPGFGSSVRLVGVTTLGGGLGAGIRAFAGDGQSSVSASNVVSRALGTGIDIVVGPGTSGEFDHSNFADVFGTITDGGGNQSGDPEFTDPVNGNFRPLPTSPVIDAGDSSADEIGSLDVAMAPRIQGAAVDIGAFELTPPGPCSTPIGDGADYESAVLAAAPAAYWRLGENSGTVAEEEIADNDGTYTGAINLGAAGAIAGDSNSAADLSPDPKSRIPTTYPHAAFNSGAVRTFEAWACRAENQGFDVLFAGDKRKNSPGLWSDHGDLDRIWFDPRREGGSSPRFWDDAMPEDGSWFHWVLVFDDPQNSAELYINGQSQGTRTVSEPYHSNPGNFQIGSYAQINEAWNGPLDEVAVYERALGAQEVASHFLLGSGQEPAVR